MARTKKGPLTISVTKALINEAAPGTKNSCAVQLAIKTAQPGWSRVTVDRSIRFTDEKGIRWSLPTPPAVRKYAQGFDEKGTARPRSFEIDLTSASVQEPQAPRIRNSCQPRASRAMTAASPRSRAW